MKRISVTTSVWTWNDVYSPLSSRDSTRVVFIRTRIGLGETWFGWILHGGPSKYIHVISVGSWRTVSLLSLLYSRLPKNYPRVSKPRYTWTEIISLLENSMVLGDLPMVSLAPSGSTLERNSFIIWRFFQVQRVVSCPCPDSDYSLILCLIMSLIDYNTFLLFHVIKPHERNVWF